MRDQGPWFYVPVTGKPIIDVGTELMTVQI